MRGSHVWRDRNPVYSVMNPEELKDIEQDSEYANTAIVKDFQHTPKEEDYLETMRLVFGD